MSIPTSPIPVCDSSSREWGVILVLTLVGACLRFWSFGRLGLTHFDEGVYAQVGAWSISPRSLSGLDPQLVAYAPPGYPILVGLAYSVFGVSDFAALFVSVLIGVITVPLVGWLGRRTFGPGGGAPAAAFASLSLAHVAFSRKALTDVSFLFMWLLAVGLGGWFLERPRLRRAVLFGIAVGVAQNFKYNGWLAGAAVLLAATFGLFSTEGREPKAIVRTFGLGLVSVLVAALCYWPWYAFVEAQPGGYGALVHHQRNYVGGLGSWPRFWSIQLGQIVALSGGARWGLMTWGVAWSCAYFVSKSLVSVERGRREDLRVFSLGLIVGGTGVVMFPTLGWWLGLTWFPSILTDRRPALRILAAWWISLSVMTPLYHPYARLWLPLHAAGWILLGGLASRLIRFAESGCLPALNASNARGRGQTRILYVGTVLLIAGCVSVGKPSMAFPVSSLFRPTDQLRTISAEIASITSRTLESGDGLRMLGRRPIYFYLASFGRIPVLILGAKDGLVRQPVRPGEWALVDDVESEQGASEISESPEILRLWRPARTWRTALDPITLLDIDPSAAFRAYRARSVPLVLFEPAPDAPAPRQAP